VKDKKGWIRSGRPRCGLGRYIPRARLWLPSDSILRHLNGDRVEKHEENSLFCRLLMKNTLARRYMKHVPIRAHALVIPFGDAFFIS